MVEPGVMVLMAGAVAPAEQAAPVRVMQPMGSMGSAAPADSEETPETVAPAAPAMSGPAAQPPVPVVLPAATPETAARVDTVERVD